MNYLPPNLSYVVLNSLYSGHISRSISCKWLSRLIRILIVKLLRFNNKKISLLFFANKICKRPVEKRCIVLNFFIIQGLKYFSFSHENSKLYIPSTLNIDLILWRTQLIVCAENVKSWFNSWFFPFTFQAYTLPHTLSCIWVRERT